MKKNCLFFFSILSFAATAQKHTDLADLGYSGPVQQLISRHYTDIMPAGGQWVLKDGASPVTTLIETFNKEGDYLQKIIRSPYDTAIISYTYENGIKTGWVKTNPNGNTMETAVFRYYGKDSLSEITTYSDDSSIATSTYILDTNGHTAELRDRVYDENGKLRNYFISYNEDDTLGLYWRIRMVDQLKQSTEIFEFRFPEKDRHGNPLRILVLKDRQPTVMRLVTVTYYQ